MEKSKTWDEALIKVADQVNQKRRQEIINIYNNRDIKEYFAKMRASNEFVKGSKSKVWRKVATVPQEVDTMFQKLYGDEYYKEKGFFEKHHREWLVVDANKL